MLICDKKTHNESNEIGKMMNKFSTQHKRKIGKVSSREEKSRMNKIQKKKQKNDVELEIYRNI